MQSGMRAAQTEVRTGFLATLLRPLSPFFKRRVPSPPVPMVEQPVTASKPVPQERVKIHTVKGSKRVWVEIDLSSKCEPEPEAMYNKLEVLGRAIEFNVDKSISVGGPGSNHMIAYATVNGTRVVFEVYVCEGSNAKVGISPVSPQAADMIDSRKPIATSAQMQLIYLHFQLALQEMSPGRNGATGI